MELFSVKKDDVICNNPKCKKTFIMQDLIDSGDGFEKDGFLYFFCPCCGEQTFITPKHKGYKSRIVEIESKEEDEGESK